MSRRDARDIAFKLVFEYEFSKTENQDALEEYTAGMDADDVAFVKEVYFGVTSHYEELLLHPTDFTRLTLQFLCLQFMKFVLLTLCHLRLVLTKL